MALANFTITPSPEEGVDCLYSPYRPLCVCAQTTSVLGGPGLKATAQVTFGGPTTAGNKVAFVDQLVGAITFTAVAGAPGLNEFQVGISAADQGNKFRAALQAHYHLSTYYIVDLATGPTVAVEARIAGVAWKPKFNSVSASVSGTAFTEGSDPLVEPNFSALLQIWVIRFPQEAVPPFDTSLIEEEMDLHVEVVSQADVLSNNPGDNRICWRIDEYLKPLVQTKFPYPEYLDTDVYPGSSRFLYPVDEYLKYVLLRAYEVYGIPPVPAQKQALPDVLTIINAAYEPEHEGTRLEEFCGKDGTSGVRFLTDMPNPFTATDLDIPIWWAYHYETGLSNVITKLKYRAIRTTVLDVLYEHIGGRSGSINQVNWWWRVRELAFELGFANIVRHEYQVVEQIATGVSAGDPTDWNTEVRYVDIKCREDAATFVFLNRYGRWDTIQTHAPSVEDVQIAHTIIDQVKACGGDMTNRGTLSVEVNAVLEITVKLYDDYYAKGITPSLALWYRQFAQSPLIYWYLGEHQFLPMTPQDSIQATINSSTDGWYPSSITLALARSEAVATSSLV